MRELALQGVKKDKIVEGVRWDLEREKRCNKAWKRPTTKLQHVKQKVEDVATTAKLGRTLHLSISGRLTCGLLAIVT